jgi:hypothetical protein
MQTSQEQFSAQVATQDISQPADLKNKLKDMDSKGIARLIEAGEIKVIKLFEAGPIVVIDLGAASKSVYGYRGKSDSLSDRVKICLKGKVAD